MKFRSHPNLWTQKFLDSHQILEPKFQRFKPRHIMILDFILQMLALILLLRMNIGFLTLMKKTITFTLLVQTSPILLPILTPVVILIHHHLQKSFPKERAQEILQGRIFSRILPRVLLNLNQDLALLMSILLVMMKTHKNITPSNHKILLTSVVKMNPITITLIQILPILQLTKMIILVNLTSSLLIATPFGTKTLRMTQNHLQQRVRRSIPSISSPMMEHANQILLTFAVVLLLILKMLVATLMMTK